MNNKYCQADHGHKTLVFGLDGLDQRLTRVSAGIVDSNGAAVEGHSRVVGQFGGVTLGTYSSNPLLTFRWKDNLMVEWDKGAWITTVSDNYQTGYHDQNSVLAQYDNTISSYSVVNATTSFSGVKNLVMSVGISNVFNRMPPYTNSNSTGLLLDYASAVGRAYQFGLTYKFY